MTDRIVAVFPGSSNGFVGRVIAETSRSVTVERLSGEPFGTVWRDQVRDATPRELKDAKT